MEFLTKCIRALFIAELGKLMMISLVFFLLLPAYACAGKTDLTLEWDAINDPSVVQVRIFQRNYPAGVYDYNNPVKVVPIPETEAVILNIPNGTYAWVARAVDEGGLQSADSNEVTDTFAVPPQVIHNLRKKLSIPSL